MHSRVDIVDLILRDHDELKALIKILQDTDADRSVRYHAFMEFAQKLHQHTKPEEQTLYEFMKGNEKLKVDALEGDAEHAIADLLVHEILETEDKDIWSAKVKVLADATLHHLKEEEKHFLLKFKKLSKEKDRIEMAEEFLEFKKALGPGLPLQNILAQQVYWEQGQQN